MVTENCKLDMSDNRKCNYLLNLMLLSFHNKLVYRARKSGNSCEKFPVIFIIILQFAKLFDAKFLSFIIWKLRVLGLKYELILDWKENLISENSWLHIRRLYRVRKFIRFHAPNIRAFHASFQLSSLPFAHKRLGNRFRRIRKPTLKLLLYFTFLLITTQFIHLFLYVKSNTRMNVNFVQPVIAIVSKWNLAIELIGWFV